MDQHALFVGATGGGKSTRMVKELAWRLGKVRTVSPALYKVILIDTKPVSFGQQDDEGHYGFTGGTIFRDHRTFDFSTSQSQLLIYRPLPALINPTEFDAFFTKLLTYRTKDKDGNLTPMAMTVIVDELIDIISSGEKRVQFIQAFTKFLVQGRSALQTLWILTQYPVYIEASIKRNVRANFVFDLPDESDRKKMAGVLGYKLVEKKLPFRWGFWYQNADIDSTRSTPLLFSGEPTRTREGGRRALQAV
ncbi:hypothetical protein [Thiomonas sp.]